MIALAQSRRLLATLAAAACLACGPALAEREAKLNIFLAPNHVAVAQGAKAFIETLQTESDGALSVRLFAGGALLGGKATLDGLKSGIADIGLLIMTYFPAELPHAQFVNDLNLMAGQYDPMVTTAAVNELIMLDCAKCLADYKAQGVVFTGNYVTPPFVIISRDKVEALDDATSKRVRAPGSTYVRWAKHVGAVPVNISGADMYEGLSRGTLDMTLQTVSALRGYSLWDVAREVTLLPLGGYLVAAEFSVSGDFWGELSEPERRAVLDAAAAGLVATVSGYAQEDAEVRALAAEKGVTISDPSAELTQSLAAFTESNREEIVTAAQSTHGIDDAEALIARFGELLEKWDGLIDTRTQSQAEIADLLRAEIYDRLDVSRYGL